MRERVGEGLRIGRRHEQAGAAVCDELRIAADRRRDHRQAARHRLEHGVRDALGARRQHEQVHRPHHIRHVGTLAGEPHAIADAQADDLGLELGAQRPVADDHQPCIGRDGRLLAAQLRKAAGERDLVLDRLQPADRADDEMARRVERRAGQPFAAPRGRAEADAVDTVADAAHARAGHPHRIDEITFEMTRQRHVVTDERAIQTAHHAVLAATPGRIRGIPAVLAMDAHRNAGRAGRHRGFERCEIAGVHDGWRELPEQAVKTRIKPPRVARRLVQLDEGHVVTHDAPAKLRRTRGQRDDCMTEGVHGQAVDQIDDAVLQTAGLKAEHDVRDHRPLRAHLRISAPASIARIPSA